MIKTKLFPKNGPLKRQIKFLLNYAILAPSGHNSQPWIFKLTGNSVTILPNFTYSRPQVDPSNRELYISLGAVSTNIAVTADNFGLIYGKKYQVDPKTKQQSITFIFRTGKTVPQNEVLFTAIPNRITNRFDYQPKPIDKDIIKSLIKSNFSDVKFTPISSPSDKQLLSKLVYESDLLWFHKTELVDELISWLRADITKHGDGLPHDTFVNFTTDERIIKKAKHEANLVINSPLSIIISSPRETILNWIHVGEALEYLLLKLSSLGLVNGYFNNPVQLITILKKLNLTFKLKGSAQLILRVGYPTAKVPRSPRRPLATFLQDMS